MPGGPPASGAVSLPDRQTPKLVLILFEGNIYSYRQYFIDSDHPKNLKPTWYGDSRAHWDGDTLIVDTIGLNDKSWIDMPGHPHTDQMHVVERFHRRDYGNLEIQNIVEDPGGYTKPWVNRISTLETGWNTFATRTTSILSIWTSNDAAVSRSNRPFVHRSDRSGATTESERRGSVTSQEASGSAFRTNASHV